MSRLTELTIANLQTEYHLNTMLLNPASAGPSETPLTCQLLHGGERTSFARTT